MRGTHIIEYKNGTIQYILSVQIFILLQELVFTQPNYI
jgi:hypothetical protein